MNQKKTKANTLAKAALGVSSLLAAAYVGTSSVDADSYTIQYGDSFYSIASQYGMDIYDLAALNNMTIDSLILPGQEISVSSSVTTYYQTSVVETVTTETSFTYQKDENGLITNTYPIGQCTWAVKELASWVGDWWGNGGDWASSASLQGYRVGYTPMVGSIICWTDGGYGHVAYVTEAAQDGRIQVLEANYNDQQWIDNYRGWFDPSNSETPGNVSYIYPNF